MNKRTIEVLGLTELKRGEKNGRPWILSKVHANDENGQPITQDLKTFEDLAQGRLELFFKREEYQGETSFMVSTYEPKPRFENQSANASVASKEMNDKLDQIISMLQAKAPAQTSDLPF